MTKQSVDNIVSSSLETLKPTLDLPTNLLDLTGALVTVLDPSGYIVYSNLACSNLSGYSSQELLGQHIWELLSSSCPRESLQKDFSQLNLKQFPVRQENSWLTKQGETKWIAWTNNTCLDENGKTEYIVATGIDITHRKLAEVELQNQCNLLQSVIQATPDAVFVKDLQGNFQLINEPFAHLFNKKVEDIIGKHISSIFPPEVCVQLKVDDAQIIASGQPETFEENVFIQGEWCTYLTTKAPYRDTEGNVLGVAGFAKDVNYLKQIQKQLKEANGELEKRVQERTKELQKANQQLQRYVENSPMAVVEWNNEFCIQVWSPAAEQMFGWQEQEVSDKCLFKWRFFHEEDMEIIQDTAQALLDGEQKSEVNSIRNYTKTGKLIHCEWYHSVLFDETGEFISILSLILDVSERKQAQEVRDRFFDLSMDMLTIASNQGYFLQVNSAVTRILGYTPQEFIAKPYLEIIHPEDKEATLAEANKLLSGVPTLYFENRYLSQDGTYKSLAWTSVAVPTEGIMYGVARDITER
ncbi:MAG: PAS domain S-box protein, partial [Spirulinaceae cyanobacterium]